MSFGGIELAGVVVPGSARLPGGADFTAALVRIFAWHAVIVAARGVGLSRAAFEATREYVDTRKAFGKPIGHFQAVAFTVADRAMDVDAGRGLVWRAAAAWDAPDRGEGEVKECLLISAQAVAFVHEAAMRCGDDGVQLHGGAGFMRDYPVEKYMASSSQQTSSSPNARAALGHHRFDVGQLPHSASHRLAAAAHQLPPKVDYGTARSVAQRVPSGARFRNRLLITATASASPPRLDRLSPERGDSALILPAYHHRAPAPRARTRLGRASPKTAGVASSSASTRW